LPDASALGNRVSRALALPVGSGIAGSLSAALPIGIDRPAGRL